MDSVGLGRQPRVHLEPAIEGDRAAAVRAYGHRVVHRVPPHGEHHRIRRSGERQDYQALEERHLRSKGKHLYTYTYYYVINTKQKLVKIPGIAHMTPYTIE